MKNISSVFSNFLPSCDGWPFSCVWGIAREPKQSCLQDRRKKRCSIKCLSRRWIGQSVIENGASSAPDGVISMSPNTCQFGTGIWRQQLAKKTKILSLFPRYFWAIFDVVSLATRRIEALSEDRRSDRCMTAFLHTFKMPYPMPLCDLYDSRDIGTPLSRISIWKERQTLWNHPFAEASEAL